MSELSLSQRDARVIWHPYTQHLQLDLPVPIIRGKGALLYDEQNKSYIDSISSWWVNIHGHAHPYIADKLYQQALALEQVIFTNFTHEPAVVLAERLLEILPGNLSRIFYSDNGSTAVEVAVKMAIQFWQNRNTTKRNKILAFENAYHGDTFGAMSVSGRGLFTDAYAGLLFETVFIETPNETNLDRIKPVIQMHEETLAAFIYEPMLQGAGGMKMYSAAAMNELLEFVQSRKIICIADEVLTGFGRTGPLFASAAFAYPADLVCLSKGLTGGTMALGVTATNHAIFEAFLSEDRTKTFFHGHSYTANPLACTAGLASLDLLMEESCSDQRKAIHQQHQAFIRDRLSVIKGGLFTQIRCLGTILAFELNTGKSEYINPAAQKIMKMGMSQGIYIRPLGNTVYLMPPYCITVAQLEQLYQFILQIPEWMEGPANE